MKKNKIIIYILFLFLVVQQSLHAKLNADSLLTISQKQSGKEKAITLNLLAENFISSDPEKAKEYSNEALNIARTEKNEKIEAEALKSIGKAFFIMSDFENALDYFKKALDIFKKLDDKKGVSSCTNNIGIIYQNWGKYPEALQNFQLSLEIDESIGNKKGIAASLQNIGIVYLNWGNYEKALENYQRSLNIKQELDDKSGIANSLNNIGQLYYMWKNYDKALENYNASLKIRIEINDKNGIATSYHNIGEVYRLIANYKKAIYYFKEAMQIQQEMGDDYNLASSFNNIGEIYSSLEDKKEALSFYSKALELHKKMGNQKGLSTSYLNIGYVYFAKKDYEKAKIYFNESLKIAEDLESNEKMIYIYKAFADLYDSIQDYEKSLKYYIRYSEVKDSIYDFVRFNEITTKYETDKLNREKQVEIDKKQSEVDRQKLYTYFFTSGFILILLFSILLYKQFSQKQKANRLLAKQKQEITDSITYAGKIQSALLIPEEYIGKILQDYFILNIPRDIVSGDFYWIYKKEEKTFLAVADCTGHGVPGAFMSMLGIAFLNEIINKTEIVKPSLILDLLRDQIIKSLHQTGREGEQQDGMDISLIAINTQAQTSEGSKPSEVLMAYSAQWAGANNPLYVIARNEITKQSISGITSPSVRNDEIELFELKGDKMPIGIYYGQMVPFTNHEISLNTGDFVYLFSDGFADQFGGTNNAGGGRKYKYNNFKNFLLTINKYTMEEQKEKLRNSFIDWKGNYDQVDDILIIGVKI